MIGLFEKGKHGFFFLKATAGKFVFAYTISHQNTGHSERSGAAYGGLRAGNNALFSPGSFVTKRLAGPAELTRCGGQSAAHLEGRTWTSPAQEGRSGGKRSCASSVEGVDGRGTRGAGLGWEEGAWDLGKGTTSAGLLSSYELLLPSLLLLLLPHSPK